jgi:hypothetical protein
VQAHGVFSRFCIFLITLQSSWESTLKEIEKKFKSSSVVETTSEDYEIFDHEIVKGQRNNLMLS